MQALDSKHPSQHVLKVQASQGSWPIHLPHFPQIKEADDETLIRLVTEGSKSESQKALEVIFNRHHKDVWRYVRSRVSSTADADEISAAVWLVVLEKICDFVWTGAPIKSWLLSIAHKKTLEFFNTPSAVSLEKLDENYHEALQYIATQLNLIDQAEAPHPIHPTVRREADEILHKLISGLSESERRIIMLIYFEEIENATEVAERLGMNKNTIRVYHKRARDKLRSSAELIRLFGEAG